MIGAALQMIVVIGSLGTNALLASRHYRRWGYVAGLVNLGCWSIMEAYYHQWFMEATNVIFLVIWIVGLKNNWNRE